MKKSTLAVAFLALLVAGCNTEVSEDEVVLMQPETTDVSCPPPAADQNAMMQTPAMTGCPMMSSDAQNNGCPMMSSDTKANCPMKAEDAKANCPMKAEDAKANCPATSTDAKANCPAKAAQPAAAEAAM